MNQDNTYENLSKQVYIISTKTNDFMTPTESRIFNLYMVEIYKANRIDKIHQFVKKLNEDKQSAYADCKSCRESITATNDKLEQERLRNKLNELNRIHKAKVSRYNFYHKWIIKIKRHNKEKKQQLKAQLKQAIASFTSERKLNHDAVYDADGEIKANMTAGLFFSTFTRALELKRNETTTEIIEVTRVWPGILRQIIVRGFKFDGKEYIYYTSGAGQIRKKKSMFARKDRLNKIWNKLTCGLSWQNINKAGGINTNKYNAYMALNNTATVTWNTFNVKRAIVVDDFETQVKGTVDHIDHQTYKITPDHQMYVPVPHMDGAGLITPHGKIGSHKCFQVRLPWIKGLLIPFDFRAFSKDVAHVKTIKDIYGETWNIDDVDVIFTKSQFKMHAYFDNWKDYQQNFIKYECEAAKFNVEENQTVNDGIFLDYQFLQTLTDLSDNEIKQIGQRTFNDIKQIGSNREAMLKYLRADKSNHNKNYFEQSLSDYPELLKDNYTKKQIKDAKAKMVRQARSGKLLVDGAFVFVLPDVYAFCEWLFCGIKTPDGLLKGNQVSCKLFDNEQKLDLLRSPHLYREHAIRVNIRNESLDKWFIAKNAIYTSTHDLISKVLMFDVDGDKLYVVSDKTFVDAAERNMQGVNPLYYEMKKAKPMELSYKNIAENLQESYKADIGKYSDAITKILNSDDKIDWDVIKWLVMENNFEIDRAKTLYMVKRPDDIKVRINQAIKGKLPWFIRYARVKQIHKKTKNGKYITKNEMPKVSGINNSMVNRIAQAVPNDNVRFSSLPGTFKVRWLMSVNLKDVDLESENSQRIIKKYEELDKMKHWEINKDDDNDKHKNAKSLVYLRIHNQLVETDENHDVNNVVNVLVKYLFKCKPKKTKEGKIVYTSSEYKKTLWSSFGREIYDNIRYHVSGTKQCLKCGERFKIKSRSKQKYCKKCR